MSEVVLDASALLAVLRDEPGAERVVNLSEVVAKLTEEGVPEMEIRRAIGRLELDVHPFNLEHAYAAGVLRQMTPALGLSFGDRACLALAQRLGGSRSPPTAPGGSWISAWRSS